MDTRKIIDYAQDGNAVGVRESLYASIWDRVHAAIEAKKQEIAQSLVAQEAYEGPGDDEEDEEEDWPEDDHPYNEEVEQIYEISKETKKDFKDRQERLAAASARTAKDPARLARLSKIPGYTAAMDLAKKTTQKEAYHDDDEDPDVRIADKELKKRGVTLPKVKGVDPEKDMSKLAKRTPKEKEDD